MRRSPQAGAGGVRAIMTEAEWLASNDLHRMLDYFSQRAGWLRGVPSERKLRLFGCACCRVLGRYLDERDQQAVELAECWADGKDVHDQLYDLVSNSQGITRSLHWVDAIGVVTAISHFAQRHDCVVLPAYAGLLRDIIGNPFNALKVDRRWVTPRVLSLAQAAYAERERDCPACSKRRCSWCGSNRACASVDCPLSICKTCCETGRIENGTLDPFRLAVLADALEEAGCDSEDLLWHLRGLERHQFHPSYQVPMQGPHVRGCWALDWVLGREGHNHDG